MNLLPDDIEQYLIDGQRQRALDTLMQRRGLTYQAALVEIARRLLEKGKRLKRPYGSPWARDGLKTSTMVARYTAKQGARYSAAARNADRRVPF